MGNQMKPPKQKLPDKPFEENSPVGGGGGGGASLTGIRNLLMNSPTEAASATPEIASEVAIETPSQLTDMESLQVRVEGIESPSNIGPEATADSMSATSESASQGTWAERVSESEWNGDQGPREQGRFPWQQRIEQDVGDDSISRGVAPALGIGSAMLGSEALAAQQDQSSSPTSADPESHPVNPTGLRIIESDSMFRQAEESRPSGHEPRADDRAQDILLDSFTLSGHYYRSNTPDASAQFLIDDIEFEHEIGGFGDGDGGDGGD
ncbi:MAG: hypothetical protein KF841_13920 [Phycisphaerae bacterium]|nr:hypothetical protein [Phycisphaerae bacterium]